MDRFSAEVGLPTLEIMKIWLMVRKSVLANRFKGIFSECHWPSRANPNSEVWSVPNGSQNLAATGHAGNS